MHASRVFTKPGVYSAELSFQATAVDGSALASPPRQLTFIVGNGTTCEDAAPAQLPITGASASLGLGALLLAAGAGILALRRRTYAG
ncbi:hypothetical protein [Bowdeniella nasicola]|uniref:hypothetical protein n=1 Tax=Bowdeniella nasicola TaxID=208480 RepID=UPI0015A23958|nr:hypothetical protein [Bowdeniella nasicola]